MYIYASNKTLNLTNMNKLFLLLISPCLIYAQVQVTGTVYGEDNNPLAYANVIEKETAKGTTTDENGEFSLEIKAKQSLLTVSYVGYEDKDVKIEEFNHLLIHLSPNNFFDEVVLVGSRIFPRSNTQTPIPIDVINAKDIVNTGQSSFDKVLQFKIPSFNAVNLPVSDAVSLLDPYEIRNLGPSRTLILVNGKRKNLSALLYTYGVASRGETGAELSSIPLDAIKRVEILRDGASAHYGTDAIAGVVNIILKDGNESYISTRLGITSKGDGEDFGLSIHNGKLLQKHGDFINYTIDLSKVDYANRPGIVDAVGESIDFGVDKGVVDEFLSRNPDGNNINSTPKNITAKFLINGSLGMANQSRFYYNALYLFKKSNSYANYRTPYWRTIEDYPYLSEFFPAPDTKDNYDGYHPSFDGLLKDYSATIGITNQFNNWNLDVSLTSGGNFQRYEVNNSHNGNSVLSQITGENLYRENSPIHFDVGGFGFSHLVSNIDLNKQLTKKIGLAVGTEFRTETFEIIEGQLASYDGGGSDSFSGSRPENAKKFNRYNIGGYLDLAYDMSDKLLLNGTIHAESYSDFGNAFVWKVSSRYKLNDQQTLRGSLSTGFKAPTLHQIYSQKLQYSFVPGQGIQVTGLINNISPDARRLEIPSLDAEKSTNFTLGYGFRISNNLNLTMDYYAISIHDRIVLSFDFFESEKQNRFNDFLRERNLKAVSFFINALSSQTNGLDFVISHKARNILKGNLSSSFSGNYVLKNKQVGKTQNPKILVDANQSLVNEVLSASLFTSRPRFKWILNNQFDKGRIHYTINNTYFGKASFVQQGLNENLKTEFIPKIVTDIGLKYQLKEKVNLNLDLKNVFNVIPEWKFVAKNDEGRTLLADESRRQTQSNLITFNQRYSTTTYQGFHFSQIGSIFTLSAKFIL